MALGILGVILLVVISIGVWRRGGLVTVLLAVALGTVIARSGGWLGDATRWCVDSFRDVAGWLATNLF